MKIERLGFDRRPYFHLFASLAEEFYRGLHQRAAGAKNIPQTLDLNWVDGVSDLTTLSEFIQTEVMPYLSGSAGPRYWGFVTGGATPVASLADWLVGVFDQNVSKDGDSIASSIERQAIEWLMELYHLPEAFSGCMTTGATAANFLACLSFRQWAGHKSGIDVALDGMAGLDMHIFTTSPHASMVKGLGMAGIGQRQLVKVASITGTEAMDVGALKTSLECSSAAAKVVIASAGTVTTTAFDDLQAIADLCHSHNAWLHVDGAFGIAERLVNRKHPLTSGIERADSVTIDNHKWLNVPYDSGVFVTRHTSLLKQSCHVAAPYLSSDGEHTDFMSLGVENSRRFRAFPVWLSLLAYGRDTICGWVRANIQQAKLLAQWIEQSDEYELIFPCELNIVLFRPAPPAMGTTQAQDRENVHTRRAMNELNQSGRVLFSPGVWQGKQVIRAALSNWQTTHKDVDIAISSLRRVAQSLNSSIEE